ncbi:MAG: aspartate/glutamate racemase family protein [Micromonosporaceae bacterium]|nr:aspartate/glutamate racemase family protein [Micromonosporaceae bacterium]
MSAPDQSPVPRGRRVYGADIGIILLDTDLPRPVGDLANARTLGFPVHYAPTTGAPVRQVVEQAADGLLDDFLATGRWLLDLGARALATSCGFLAIYQRELASALPAPVATSSLLQIPLVLRLLQPDERVAVLTINGSTLSPAHFEGVGVTGRQRERVQVIGLEHTDHLYPVIVGRHGPLDVERARAEVVDVCRRAVSGTPEIGAFVFECTNLPPYAQSVRDATGRPVWDAVTLVRWLREGVSS